MNIGLVKIGQKIYFNRDNKAVKRSNTNGNQGLYKMIMLLVENNKGDNFYMISDSDIQDFKPADNIEQYRNENLDVVFVITGLGEYEKSISLISELNTLYFDGVKFIFLCEDPRCLESMEQDGRMNFIPSLIITQTVGMFKYKNKNIKMIYVPIEKAICYKYKECNNVKKNKFVIAIANTSGDKYNRTQILSNLLDKKDIPVYGRLTSEEDMLFKDYRGELEYVEMMDVLRKSLCTIIIPIRKGWVTSKYMEALMNDVYPIFYVDYNISLLKMKDVCLVKDKVGLQRFLMSIQNPGNNEYIKERIKEWKALEVTPFTSGKQLSKMIMEVI